MSVQLWKRREAARLEDEFRCAAVDFWREQFAPGAIECALAKLGGADDALTCRMRCVERIEGPQA